MPWRLHPVRGSRVRVTVPLLPEANEPSAPPLVRPERRRESSHYALVALAREGDAVACAGVGSRHAELNRAAFKLARFIRSGELTAAEVVADLIDAARRAGLEDSEAELRRYLRYGLRAGLDRTGYDHGS